MDIIDKHNITEKSVAGVKTCPFLSGMNVICVDVSDDGFWSEIRVNVSTGITKPEKYLMRNLNEWDQKVCGNIYGVSGSYFRNGSVFPKGTHPQSIDFKILNQYIQSNISRLFRLMDTPQHNYSFLNTIIDDEYPSKIKSMSDELKSLGFKKSGYGKFRMYFDTIEEMIDVASGMFDISWVRKKKLEDILS